jgi:hypothetical protein
VSQLISQAETAAPQAPAGSASAVEVDNGQMTLDV